MSNFMIVNPGRNLYLAVTESSTDVQVLPISQAQPNTVSAFWTMKGVTGGYTICLESNPTQCLDINANSSDKVGDGTQLVISSVDNPNFFNSNLWNVGQLANQMAPGIVSQIESMATAGDLVIDSGASPTAQLWTDLNNDHQTWQILSVQ